MNAVDATLLLKPIGDVEWPASLKTRTRIRNLFRNKGVRTVGDLSKTREELMRAPNLGNVSVTAIETALAGMNLQLERQ